EFRIMIQSVNANATYYTPILKRNGKWLVIQRWYGKHNKLIKLCWLTPNFANTPHFEFIKFVPILPKTHWIRKWVNKNVNQ
ncbi:MAG: hypothetical protein ACOC2F_00460, partial [Bacteroidota bacterium]